MAALQFAFTWHGYRGPRGTFQAEAHVALSQTLDGLAGGLETRVRREAPVSPASSNPPGQSPGRLRAGLKVKAHHHGNGGDIELTSDMPYTKYVIRGRGEVRARPGGFLRFFLGGRWVYAKRVRAVPPNDFIGRAVKDYRPQVQQHLGRLTAAIAEAFFSE